jgi:hypothetical protein
VIITSAKSSAAFCKSPRKQNADPRRIKTRERIAFFIFLASWPMVRCLVKQVNNPRPSAGLSRYLFTYGSEFSSVMSDCKSNVVSLIRRWIAVVQSSMHPWTCFCCNLQAALFAKQLIAIWCQGDSTSRKRNSIAEGGLETLLNET